MRKLRKFAEERPLFAFGCIGTTLGNVLYKIAPRSFKSADMQQFLQEIREKAGNEMKISLILDNA